MVNGSIPRRYARAMMEIGVAQASYEQLGREVRDLAAAMSGSPELTGTLSHPAFPRADRRKVLMAVLKRLGASPMTTNFTMLLLDRDRIGIVPDISRELDAMIDDKAGRVSAEVTSTTALSALQLGQLKASLEKVSGKKVEIQKKEDPELLGGMIAKVGDIVYDGSLRGQLARLRAGLA